MRQILTQVHSIRKPLYKKLAEAAWKLGVRGLLPGEAAQQEKQAVISGPSRAVSRGPRPLRVLLVEDSEDDATLTLQALRSGGYEPLCRRVETRAGMEAALADAEWDILVSDYHLPEFDAIEALQILKESRLDLPFIVVSGKVGEDVAVEAMRAGAHDYLIKNNLVRLGPAVEREVREARGRRERRRAEAMLRESEHKFRSLFQNSSDITLVLDARGTILYESPPVEWVLGYAPEERVGRNVFDLIHPGDVEQVSDALALFLEEPDVSLSIEYRARHKDGPWRHFEAVGNNLLSDPIVEGIVVNSRDITDRKRTEEELKESEDRHRAVVEQAAENIFLADLDTKRILEANAALCGSLGYTNGELQQITLYDIVAHDRESIDVNIRRLMEEGPSFLGERSYRRKDGSLIDVEVSASVISYSGKEAMCIVAHDVSERKRAEEDLCRQRDLYEGVLTAQSEVGEGFLIAEGSRISFANGAFCEISGYGSEELLALPSFFELLPPEQRRMYSERFVRRMSGEGGQDHQEIAILRKDGQRVELEIAVKMLQEESRTRFIIIARDITERKQAEEDLRHSLGRLLVLYEASQIVTSTVNMEERGARLLMNMHRVADLSAAVINLRDERGQTRVLKAIGAEHVWGPVHDSPEARAARYSTLKDGGIGVFRPRGSDPDAPPVGICLPLQGAGQAIGTLEVFGTEALTEKQTLDVLTSLTSLAGSALENARLYGELAEREHQLEDLVGKLMTAQEEERRRVAYEVHDGLAQVAAAAHQHLQAFARFYPPDSEESREILHQALELVQQTVVDARRIIANLRPTALDDFGLQAAVRLEVEALREEDWSISFQGTLRDDERLPFVVETGLFRVVQEAFTNIRKHANTKQVHVSLDHLEQSIRLSVQDWGQGFDPAALPNTGGPGERIGLSSMRERVALLGGDFQISSHPGAGVLVIVAVPLPKQREVDHEGDAAV